MFNKSHSINLTIPAAANACSNEAQYPYQDETIETQRLAALSTLYDTHSLEWLARHIKVDDKVLEMGSGDGQLARQVLNMIGEHGKYLGIEVNPKRVETAQLTLAVCKNAELRQQDAIEAAATLPKASYDVIYFRWFLWTVPLASRISFLDNLFSLLKPGGVILAEEADMTALHCEPTHACIEQHKRDIELRCKLGGHPLTLGPEMPAIFKQAEPAAIVSDAECFQPVTNKQEYKLLLYFGAQSARDSFLKAGLDAKVLDANIAQLKEIAEDETYTLRLTANYCTSALLEKTK